MNGKIHDSVGFTSTDGTTRQLTLRDRLQQIINLGQPQDIRGVRTTVRDAEVALIRFKSSLLDEEVGSN
jgi:hypothetical protein